MKRSQRMNRCWSLHLTEPGIRVSRVKNDDILGLLGQRRSSFRCGRGVVAFRRRRRVCAGLNAARQQRDPQAANDSSN